MTANKQIGVSIYVASFIIIITGMIYSAAILTPLLMAFFLSIICAEPITWLQKKKVPQTMAILIVFILVVVMFLGFGVIIGNSLSSFSENASQYEDNLMELRNSFYHFLSDKGVDISSNSLESLFEPSKVMSFTAAFIGELGGLMGNAFTIFFLVLFLLLELDSVTIKAKAIILGSGHSLKYFNVIGESIRHYLSIKTMTSLLTGVLIWIGLAVIGVDYAIIWGLLAFLLNYIPNIGSIVAAFPAVVFSLIQFGFGGVLGTALVFLVVNMVIGNVVEPKMMGDGLGLSTFIVFFSLLFWGFVFGTVGMFLSVPLTMAIKIMLEQNPGTKAFAIVLGTQSEAQAILDKETD